ncbi:hypothetical protein RAH41_02305 [Gottfriedia acidiceleris]|uniref:hypothetical protein n=1 Tax=Gottfriedia acidiceleris TaxID=371036 RepID=UPI002F267967
MKITKKVFVRNLIVIFSMIIIIGLGIFVYGKTYSSYPITKTNETKVEKINSSLIIVRSDLNELEKKVGNENEKNKVIELEQKTMEDIEKLDEVLENFKFKKTPDKGLLLWIICATSSKDAYLMDLMSYGSGDTKGNEFSKSTIDHLNDSLKEMKNKHKEAYRYFKRNHYIEGFYNQ